MAKSYLFDGRSLGALLVSGGLAGLLLFVAGVVVGYHWSGVEMAAASAPPAPSPAAPSQGTLTGPPPPVADGAQQPQILARRRLPNRPSVPGAPPTSLGEARYTAFKVRSAASAGSRGFEAATSAETPAAEEAPADSGAQPVAEVADQEPSPEPRPEFDLPPLPPPPPAFSLQVGAFLQPDNLERFMADLSDRGYTPRVLEVTSSSGRILSIVRVGGFTNRAEASQAALTFREREGMEALVRPEAHT